MLVSDALAMYLDAKRAEGIAKSTARNYADHIGRWVASLPAERRNVGQPTTSDVTGHIAELRDRGRTESGVYGRYRALDLFFNWCSESEEVGRPRSPLKNSEGKRLFKVRKPSKKDPRRAAIETIDALVDAIPRGSWLQLRNRTILRLMRDTGARVGEIAEIKISDLNLKNRILHIPKSKARKYRNVRFTEKTAQEAKAYLLCRPECPPEVGDYLFVAGWNDNPEHGAKHKLTDHGIRMMLRKLCERNDMPHVNPHSIRHMFATEALNAGIRLEVVSDLMGHSDPSFTKRVYAELLDETAQREYDERWK